MWCIAVKSKAGVLQPLYRMDLDGLDTVVVAPVLWYGWLVFKLVACSVVFHTMSLESACYEPVVVAMFVPFAA